MTKGFMKKVMALLLVFVMVLAAFAGCVKEVSEPDTSVEQEEATTTEAEETSAPEEDAVPSYLEHADEPIEFDWLIDLPWFVEKWGVDKTTQYITEKTGVSFNIIPTGSDKMEAMVAAGEVPDFVTYGRWKPFVGPMYDAGLVFDLEELAEMYEPAFFDVAEPSIVDTHRYTDGNLYRYPNYAQGYTEDASRAKMIDGQAAFSVRKDIYEAIGSPDMTTPEGFLAGLRAVKEMYGDEIIPFSINEPYTDSGTYGYRYLAELLGIHQSEVYTYETHYEDAEMKKWLKTFSQAYREGLMSDANFIDNENTFQEKVTQGLYFMILGSANKVVRGAEPLYAEDASKQYITIDGPKGENEPLLRGGGAPVGWLSTSISSSCKDPERAIEFLTYALSEEGQLDFFFGSEDMWEEVDGERAFTPEVLEAFQQSEDFRKTYGAVATWLFFMQFLTEKAYAPAYQEPKESLMAWSRGKVAAYPVYEGLIPDGNTDPGIVQTKYNMYISEFDAKIILAESDEEFDALYAELAEWKADNDYQILIDYYNERITENKDIIESYK